MFVDEIAELNGKCRILMYTDGLPEARNPQGEVFGQQRLVDWLRTTTEAPGSAEDLKSDLVNMLEQFQQNTTLQDDQTFLLMVE
jgi:serine phosphatase RsbU (regulator of sigma subunit)